MSKKDDILKATQELLWEVGYEAMSPKKVLQASGAGQGSLYHHFEGKEALVLAVIKNIQQELQSEIDTIFLSSAPALDKLEKYILKQRLALRGCKLGRLAQEKSIIESPIRNVISDYFCYVHQQLTETIKLAQQDKVIDRSSDATGLATTIQATIQGGYTLARITQDEKMMSAAQKGVWQLLLRNQL